jgi:hypothetical protein
MTLIQQLLYSFPVAAIAALMVKGERSAGVQAAQEKLWQLYSGFTPANETQKIFFAEAVRTQLIMNSLLAARIGAKAGAQSTNLTISDSALRCLGCGTVGWA